MPRPSPRAPLVLALDLGTSSVRTALFDERARLIPGSLASQRYRVAHSPARGAELDPAVLLRATRRCLRQTRRHLRQGAQPVIAGSAFWHSLLGLDRAGRPLTPIYTWADARCAPDAARLRARLDERKIQARTGCMLRASFWPAKLAWLQRTQPRLFRRVARWVSPAEFVFAQLFGAAACSHSMASGTGLYHLTGREWDAELLQIVGLSTEQLNSLQDEVRTKAGIVFPAIGDGAASNLGSGATRDRWFAINAGTSAAIRAVPSRPVRLPFGLFQFAIDEQRQLVGGAVSNAGNLRAWSRRELRLPNDERKLEKALAQAAATPSPLTILPCWIGERAPTWPEGLAGAIVGITQATTAPQLLAAELTATCLRLADILELLESALGRARRIIVSGGILRSPASLQILADSLGRTLHLSAEQEASLRGAAVHALGPRGIPAPKAGGRVRPRRARALRAFGRRARQRALEELLRNFAAGENAPSG